MKQMMKVNCSKSKDNCTVDKKIKLSDQHQHNLISSPSYREWWEENKSNIVDLNKEKNIKK